MIKKLERFQTADGKEFKHLTEAQKYNSLLEACDNIENELMTLPSDDLEFSNGVGWLEHPKGTKLKLEGDIVREYNKWFNTTETNINYTVGRIVDDNNLKCLNHLIYRWQCISKEDKEYGQPYYANNPLMAVGGKIN